MAQIKIRNRLAQVARQVRPVNDHQDLRQVFAPALCNTSVHVPTLLVIIE
jgi:hypothetical protein